MKIKGRESYLAGRVLLIAPIANHYICNVSAKPGHYTLKTALFTCGKYGSALSSCTNILQTHRGFTGYEKVNRSYKEKHREREKKRELGQTGEFFHKQ